MRPILNALSVFSTVEERVRCYNAIFPDNVKILRPKLDEALRSLSITEFSVPLHFSDTTGRPIYQVTSKGRVCQVEGTEITFIDPTVDEDGELIVEVQQMLGKTKYFVKDLVAFRFVIPADELMDHFPFHVDVFHLDGDKTNCDMTNLEWRRRDS